MRRKRLLISVGLVFGFVVLVIVGLCAMAKHEPSYYRQATLPAGYERQSLSAQTTGQFFTLSNALAHGEDEWPVTFKTEELNAYFQEQYYNHGGDDNLPDGFSAPRVKLEDGKMRVGVRYGKGSLSTILTLEIKLWLVKDEVNVLAMEIVSLQAGSLPLSTGTLLDYISEAARRENIDITWYRHEGHPVAIMRFQADLTRPTFQFKELELKGGELRIVGRSTDLLAPLPPPRPVPK
jgi:hypothetical protein